VNANGFERLTPLLATYLIHSTCFITAAALAMRLRPPRLAGLRQAAWKLAMLLGVITAPLQTGLAIVPYSGQVALPMPGAEPADGEAQSLPTIASQSTVQDRSAMAVERLASSSAPSGSDSVAGLPDEELAEGSVVGRSLGERSPGPASVARPANGPRRAWHVAIGVLWLVGVSFFAVRLAFGRLRLGSRRRLIELRRGPERRALDELCRQAGVRRRVRLYRVDDGGSPIAWAWCGGT
jgi:hypothetical protein